MGEGLWALMQTTTRGRPRSLPPLPYAGCVLEHDHCQTSGVLYLVGRPRFAAADRMGRRSSFCGLDSSR